MTDGSPAYLPARQAARLLKIDVRSLYAYVSRGWIHSIPALDRRGRLYSRSDIERLQARQRARGGHGAAAAGALRWGEPVLESSITEAGPAGFRYRGHDVLEDLVHRRFEDVAELLWSGSLPGGETRWRGHHGPLRGRLVASALRRAAKHDDPKLRLADFVATIAILETEQTDHAALSVHTARALYIHVTRLVAGPDSRDAEVRGIAATLARGWGASGRDAADHLNAALILCADHELNPSAFVARVAASNGAGLVSCLEAAVATHRGVRQGLAGDMLESMLREAGSRGNRLLKSFEAVLTRDGSVPGFGHPLYPDGDPRALFLIQAARRIAPRSARLNRLLRVIDWAASRAGAHPNLDCGLVALTTALDLPPKTATTIYSLGRIAGWVAHVLEQRAMKFSIRPRARYVRAAGEAL